MKQFNPVKPIKREYKGWCHVDSQTGYISKFEIYTRKSNKNTDLRANLEERVISNFIEDLQNSKKLVDLITSSHQSIL